MQLCPPTFEPGKEGGTDKEIAVLMSGGVDSSVTAMLLRQAGWNVLGVTMKIPVAQSCANQPRPCCGEEAAFVCHKLGIPHYFLDVGQAFEENVVNPFRNAYASGLTPNPCVNCNTFLKFDLVWNFLGQSLGIRYLATGHYSRVIHEGDHTYLARAKDLAKDQSYFLYGIPRQRLPYLILPLGEMTKPEVRELARRNDLHIAEKPESMELCFAGEGDYRKALAEGEGRGPVLNMAGDIIAWHEGIAHYTIGQRKGLGFAAGVPLYVTRISPRDNSITVGTREEASCNHVSAETIRILIPEKVHPGTRLYGKIRSYGNPSACMITEANNDKITVEFDSPQFAPTPGQHMVLYDGDGNVIGGGIIC